MLLPIEQVKSPLTIKVALDRVAKAGLELTPEAMINILKCTNHKVSIRDVLKMIPEGKEAEFKEAICSAVECREHTEANLERMREIAKIGGFEAEFEEAHAKEKWIGNTYKRTFIAKSNEDLANNPDLSGYGTVICDFYGKTKFADLTKLPKRMIIKGDIDWSRRDFEKLPDLSESIVYGSFDCHGCKNLTSLEGAPNVVGGDFDCSECSKLESLEGVPKEVGGSFFCYNCDNLASLDWAPKKVGEYFYCGGCKNLKSLRCVPKKVVESFCCDGCDNLVSLDGAPEYVGGDFRCNNCKSLTSAKGLPAHIFGKIECDDKLRSEIDKELEKRKKDKDKKETSNIASNIFSRIFNKGK